MAISSRQLQTLLAVMETGSFATAADKVGYSASNVSQQMLALEQETGVRLFMRNARSVTPTEDAHELAKQASRVLGSIDVMVSSSRAVQEAGKDLLRVGVFPSLAARVLPRVLSHPDWQESKMDLRVSVAEPWETADQLRNGDLDAAFVFQIGQSSLPWPPSITRTVIGVDPFRVVVPATWGLAEGTRVTLEELSARPWVMQYPGGSDGVVIEQQLRNHGFKPRVVGISDDFNATGALVAGGLGAAFLPEMSLYRVEGLARIQLDGLQLQRDIVALTSRERRGTNPQELIRIFKESLDAVGNSGPSIR